MIIIGHVNLAAVIMFTGESVGNRLDALIILNKRGVSLCSRERERCRAVTIVYCFQTFTISDTDGCIVNHIFRCALAEIEVVITIDNFNDIICGKCLLDIDVNWNIVGIASRLLSCFSNIVRCCYIACLLRTADS